MSLPLHNILFLDIETVPQYPSFEMQPPEQMEMWNIKAKTLTKYHEGETNISLYPRAGIYAEFGKIICISCGILNGLNDDRKLIIKSFAGDDEREILSQFATMLDNWYGNEMKYLCAHNGKEFDFPYLCRRLIINHLYIPALLNLAGKKPWEVNHFDTLEMWKFGDYKSFTSLALLAHTLGIPTPKDDIDGSVVWEVYWVEKNLQRIITYCQKDVITVAQIFLRLHGQNLLKQENINIKS